MRNGQRINVTVEPRDSNGFVFADGKLSVLQDFARDFSFDMPRPATPRCLRRLPRPPCRLLFLISTRSSGAATTASGSPWEICRTARRIFRDQGRCPRHVGRRRLGGIQSRDQGGRRDYVVQRLRGDHTVGSSSADSGLAERRRVHGWSDARQETADAEGQSRSDATASDVARDHLRRARLDGVGSCLRPRRRRSDERRQLCGDDRGGRQLRRILFTMVAHFRSHDSHTSRRVSRAARRSRRSTPSRYRPFATMTCEAQRRWRSRRRARSFQAAAPSAANSHASRSDSARGRPDPQSRERCLESRGWSAARPRSGGSACVSMTCARSEHTDATAARSMEATGTISFGTAEEVGADVAVRVGSPGRNQSAAFIGIIGVPAGTVFSMSPAATLSACGDRENQNQNRNERHDRGSGHRHGLCPSNISRSASCRVVSAALASSIDAAIALVLSSPSAKITSEASSV